MTTANPIRVLIADHHAIVRRGIAAVLEIVPDIELGGEARDGWEAVAQAERLRPDVILMDLVMPKLNGIEAIRRIEARILVLTTFAGENKIFPTIQAAALGYDLKISARRSCCRPSAGFSAVSPRFTPSSPARSWRSCHDPRTARRRPIR